MRHTIAFGILATFLLSAGTATRAEEQTASPAGYFRVAGETILNGAHGVYLHRMTITPAAPVTTRVLWTPAEQESLPEHLRSKPSGPGLVINHQPGGPPNPIVFHMLFIELNPDRTSATDAPSQKSLVKFLVIAGKHQDAFTGGYWHASEAGAVHRDLEWALKPGLYKYESIRDIVSIGENTMTLVVKPLEEGGQAP